MRIAPVVFALALLPGLVSAQAVDRTGTRPKPHLIVKEDPDPLVLSDRCGVFVKWVGTSIGEQAVGQGIPTADLQSSSVEFWNGPYYTEDAKAIMEQSMLTGHWGAFHIDGQHNSSYSAEFFPPTRIARMRWEYDCWR